MSVYICLRGDQRNKLIVGCEHCGMGGKKGYDVGAFWGAGNVFYLDGGVVARVCGIV